MPPKKSQLAPRVPSGEELSRKRAYFQKQLDELAPALEGMRDDLDEYYAIFTGLSLAHEQKAERARQEEVTALMCMALESLDNALSATVHPLPHNKEESGKKRKACEE